jgi:hypothetical protein
MIDFVKEYWPIIILVAGFLTAVCAAAGKWMLNNDTKWDDALGAKLKWVAGLLTAIKNAFKK